MTRKAARELAVHMVFAGEGAQSILDRESFESMKDIDELYSEYPDDRQLDYINRVVSLAEEKADEIDAKISSNSKGWSLERISSTALAVLRVAICEILFMDDIPNASAINEAVEIAKKYDEDSTVSFINGVLGSVVRSL